MSLATLNFLKEAGKAFFLSFHRRLPLLVLWSVCCFFDASVASAQTLLRGHVKDARHHEPLIGVHVFLEKDKKGTLTDVDGYFEIEMAQERDLLKVSYIGYEAQHIEVKKSVSIAPLRIFLKESAIMGREVVVSASLAAEDYMTSPVSIELVRARAIRTAPTPDYYESLAHIQGVSMNTSSINLSTINTRGFGNIANFHFVQLIDWMDSASPTLNFPTGNLVGINELDIEGVELVPGASSALYGPNSFNGLLVMKSKTPFEYPGLSAQLKLGMTHSDASAQLTPMLWSEIRYARVFQDRFGFKANIAWMRAQEWLGNDYLTDRMNNTAQAARNQQPDFDGLNLYGDEIDIPIPLPVPFEPIRIRRTGFTEEDLLGNDKDARNIKTDMALYYRYRPKSMLSYSLRYGLANSVLHAADKYVLRGFGQFFHKLEWTGPNHFARAYTTGTNAGQSYNLGALGLLANEAYKPTEEWVTDYVTQYLLTLQGHTHSIPGGVPNLAHESARSYAERHRPERGSLAYNRLIEDIKQKALPAGAGFKDYSRLYHIEGTYNFKNWLSIVEIQMGGNFRVSDIFSDGTIFNEAPEEGQIPRHFITQEGGFYTQFAKGFFNGIWRLKGSVRYDKKQNYKATYTPRLSSVLALAPQHFVRASYQTAFRNPDSQAQFIYFFTSDGIVLGSSEENAKRYGIHNGGAYTYASYQAYLNSGGQLNEKTGAPENGNPDLLKPIFIPYVRSERLQSIEVGYRGLFKQALLLDANIYYNRYRDFITSEVVVSQRPTTHQGEAVPAGSRFRPFVNVADRIHAHGIGLQARYKINPSWFLNGSYNYANFGRLDNHSNFTPAFNTPRHQFNLALSKENLLFKSIGASVAFRWQDHFEWRAPMGDWVVPSYGVLNAELHYPVPGLKSFIKFGGTNLLQADYRSQLGGPFIGRQYYISIRYETTM